MEKEDNNITFGSIFVAMLSVAFIVLKLTGHIDWSWLWVLSPIWIHIGISILVILIYLLIVFIKK